jgi:hypothetical protein
MGDYSYVFDYEAMSELIRVQYDFDVALIYKDWDAVQQAQQRLERLYDKLKDRGMASVYKPVKISEILMGAAQ